MSFQVLHLTGVDLDSNISSSYGMFTALSDPEAMHCRAASGCLECVFQSRPLLRHGVVHLTARSGAAMIQKIGSILFVRGSSLLLPIYPQSSPSVESPHKPTAYLVFAVS